MTYQTDEAFIMAAIQARVKQEIEHVVGVELNAAFDRMSHTIRQKADAMAIELMTHYDISRSGTNVVITVKKGS